MKQSLLPKHLMSLKHVENKTIDCTPYKIVHKENSEANLVGVASEKSERLDNGCIYRIVSLDSFCSERGDIEDLSDNMQHKMLRLNNESSDHDKFVGAAHTSSVNDVEDLLTFQGSLSSNECQSIKTVIEFSGTLEQRNLYACSICEKIFVSSESLSVHMLSHVNEKIHLNQLETQAKDDSAVRKKNSIKGEPKWACQICEKAFRTSKALREHEVVHTGARDFPCNICGKAFGTAANMRIHHTTHSDLRPFACLTCGATFRQKDSLKVHVRKHTGERPFICTVCNMTFDRNFTLKNHMLTHASEKSYVCSACGKAFSTRGGLNNHERLHFKDTHQKKERPPRAKPGTGNWVCDECGKIYSTRSNLRMHQRTHEPIQVSHICPVCSKTYKSRDSMEVHMRRHSEERPYKCTMCSKSFYRNYTLKLHILTHTGEKPHHCPIQGCIKSFAQSSSLSYHIRNHQKQEERKINQGNNKRTYKKRKAFLASFPSSVTISFSGSTMKDCETVDEADQNITKEPKPGTDSPIHQHQNIKDNIVVSTTSDNTSVQPVLDISNSVIHQMSHVLPSVWDDNNSMTMVGVVNGMNHGAHGSLQDSSTNLEMETENCQQLHLMQFVPADTLPLLVSIPDSVLYHQDSVERGHVELSPNMLIPHLH